jgi:hypothetical protein
LLVALVCALFSISFPVRAEAKPKLGIDAEGAFALAPSGVSSGFGGALRLGYELDAVVLSLTPEIGGSYHHFSGVYAPDTFRGFGGARLAVGALVRAGIYGHAGYAHVAYDRAASAGLPAATRSAPTFDGGLFLDLTVLPVIDLGLHAGYGIVAGNHEGDANQWLAAGGHVAFVF